MLFFFDLDGPILDVSEKYYRIYCDFLLQNTDAEILPKKTFWTLKRNRVSDEAILELSGVGTVSQEYNEFKKQNIEDDKYLSYDEVWPELTEFYAKLFKEHVGVLVTLRTHADKTVWELEHHLKIISWFSKVLSLSGDSYPSDLRWKAKINAIVNSGFDLPVLKDGIFFVGDTETDIRAARELGVFSVGVSFGIRSKELLQTAKPDIIVDTPRELSEFLKGKCL